MNLLTTAVQTMTSREIADLVESRHDSVKRTVMRRFVAECRMVTPSFAEHPYFDGRFKLVRGAT